MALFYMEGGLGLENDNRACCRNLSSGLTQTGGLFRVGILRTRKFSQGPAFQKGFHDAYTTVGKNESIRDGTWEGFHAAVP